MRTKAQAGRFAKTKGNANERFVAKRFQNWWGFGTFVRTPSSGGWGNKKEFKTEGDVVPEDKLFPFHLELKKQENWTLEGLFSDKCIVWKWWNQARTECTPPRKPMLVFTRNHMPQFCVLKLADIPNFVVLKEKSFVYRDVCILPLEDLFKCTDREYWTTPKKEKSNGKRKEPKPDPNVLPEQLSLFEPKPPTESGEKRSIF